MLGAQQQLVGYFNELQCEVLDGYSLSIESLQGATRYKLFSLGNVAAYINLRHRGLGVIEYWFSIETHEKQTVKVREVYPAAIVQEYRNYKVARQLQEHVYATMKGISGALLVTVGVAVGATVIGITLPVISSVAASWLVTAGTNITVATAATTSAASKIIWRAGYAIQQVFTTAPSVTGLALITTTRP